MPASHTGFHLRPRECSDTVVGGVAPKLAETLANVSATYRREITKWGLDERDQRVLKLALNTIGEGNPNGPLKAQPWKSFLASCRDWASSGSFEKWKELKAQQIQAYRFRKSTMSEIVPEEDAS
ncbi:hypothetical protein QFC20_005932 [Naganishia adeliensis]|uniref:Uncharacterized protein n=1 Tax=Naganishia adeliensis TaxID=92952 RepID=A0ACC2VIY1_9TREE|nr:hypothetical protein QFC20_005932 [Naganishia adeliensis]